MRASTSSCFHSWAILNTNHVNFCHGTVRSAGRPWVWGTHANIQHAEYGAWCHPCRPKWAEPAKKLVELCRMWEELRKMPTVSWAARHPLKDPLWTHRATMDPLKVAVVCRWEFNSRWLSQGNASKPVRPPLRELNYYITYQHVVMLTNNHSPVVLCNSTSRTINNI